MEHEREPEVGDDDDTPGGVEMSHRPGDIGEAGVAGNSLEADDTAVAAGQPADGDTGTEGDRDQPPTGEPRVDAAIRAIGDLDDVPLKDHPAIFERIHRQLVDVLGELHSGPEPSGPEPSGSG